MTRPAKDPVPDAEAADRQFGRHLARRWGATAGSDRRRSAIRISARKMRVFAVTGGRTRLAQLSVPRATQQPTSAAVASTADQPIAPPSGAPEALQIWREREQAALEAELAEQQAHEEAVERAARRRALRTATRQLPATETRTPGATMASISPREIKVARPADVAAIGKLPAQPKLNANMHAAPAPRPPVVTGMPAQPGPVRPSTGPVETKRGLARPADADGDDSEDDTAEPGAEVRTAPPAAPSRAHRPVGQREQPVQPWRPAQAQTVSATLQQSALNATAAQNLAPDDDRPDQELGLSHLFNSDLDSDAADPGPPAEQPHRPPTLATASPRQGLTTEPSEDDDLGGAFSQLFDETQVEPHGELTGADGPPADTAHEPQVRQPERRQQPAPKRPVGRRAGSMWDADADPANADPAEEVGDEDDDLAPAFAQLFDETPDEPELELKQTNEPRTGLPSPDEPETDAPQPEAEQQQRPEAEQRQRPEAEQPRRPEAEQPIPPRAQPATSQPQVQPRRTQPVVRRPGSMWDVDADPADPDLDETVVDEDDDLAPAFAHLFDENPDEPRTELTEFDESPADLRQSDEPEPDAPQPDGPEGDAPQPDEPEGDAPQPQQPKQVQQPKRSQPVLRRPGSMWDADADPAHPDFDADVAEDDDELGSAFAQLFDEKPGETPTESSRLAELPTESNRLDDLPTESDRLDEPATEAPAVDAPRTPEPSPQQAPRTVPAWDEADEADEAQDADVHDDDLRPAFAQLFGEDPQAEQQAAAPAVQRDVAAVADDATGTDGTDEQAGLGLDGLFDEGDDAPSPPAPVQPPPAWRATPPSTRSAALVQQHQLAPVKTSAALLDVAPRQVPKRAVALALANKRSTSIAMPDLLTTKRATGWMTTTRALSAGFVAAQVLQPAPMPQTGATGGAFLHGAASPMTDESDAAPEAIGVTDPAAVPDIVRQGVASPEMSMSELVRQRVAPPRMSVRELVAHFDRGAAPNDARAALTDRPLADLPRALTVAPPRISVQPDPATLGEPEVIGSAASTAPSAARPVSAPASAPAVADAAFAALATKIVGPPTPAGARPALPTPLGGPLVSPHRSAVRATARRKPRNDAVPPTSPAQDAFPELSHGSQSERLDALVDRVVERIEQRVIDELERRGRRHSRGVF